MIRDSEHSSLHKSVGSEMAYAGLSILSSLRTTLGLACIDPVCISSSGKMSLTFLLKTCLYGCVLQGVTKNGSVSGSVLFAKPSASSCCSKKVKG
jgi:hypothetical protein